MMKILLPSLSIMLLLNFNQYMLSITIILMMIMMKMFNNLPSLMNNLCYLDHLSYMLITLTFMSILLIILSSYNMKKIITPLFMIFIMLILTFSMKTIFNFYIMFELVLIPTMIMIMKSGKQPERLQAGIYLMIYTIMASLPLLFSIMMFKMNLSFNMIFLLMMKYKLIIFMLMAFLIKMPMFFTHLWLPKAHVEAPLEGSMILAAVLLKLGGYGLIRMMPICLNKMYSMNYWLISISLMGATATSLNCLRQKDLKALIAYSSVAHMALVLTSIFTMNLIGLQGAMIMMIAHGLSSSALFMLVNDLYMKLHTRNIMLFKGLMSSMPNLTFWWFLFMAINISAPPSINTISEIFIMSSLITWSKLTMIPIMLASFAVASFSLSLFINIIHNKNESLKFNPTNHKIFLSLMIHITPLMFILMKMNIFYI